VLRPFVFDPAHPYAGGQHRGIDIGAAAGTPVRAPTDGIVTFAGAVPSGGKTISVETPFGYSATLLHLGSIAVARGAPVTEGSVVGTAGAESFVYFGLRTSGNPQGYLDPLLFLPPRPVPQPTVSVEPVTPSVVQPSETAPATPEPVAGAPAVADVVAPGAEIASSGLPAEPAASSGASAESTEAVEPPAYETASPAVATATVDSAAPTAAPASSPEPVPASTPAITATDPLTPSASAEPATASVADPTPVPAAADAAVTPQPGAAIVPVTNDAPLMVDVPADAGVDDALLRGAASDAVRGADPNPVAVTPSAPVDGTATPIRPPSSHARGTVSLQGPRPARKVAVRAHSPGPVASRSTGSPARRSRSHHLLPPIAAALTAVAVAALLHRRRRDDRRPPRIIVEGKTFQEPILGEATAESPRCARVAVRERAAASGSRGRVRGAGGHLRAVPPAQGQRRPDGERDGRTRHADDGRRRQRGRLAA
jgi:hypothetical protein